MCQRYHLSTGRNRTKTHKGLRHLCMPRGTNHDKPGIEARSLLLSEHIKQQQSFLFLLADFLAFDADLFFLFFWTARQFFLLLAMTWAASLLLTTPVPLKTRRLPPTSDSCMPSTPSRLVEATAVGGWFSVLVCHDHRSPTATAAVQRHPDWRRRQHLQYSFVSIQRKKKHIVLLNVTYDVISLFKG